VINKETLSPEVSHSVSQLLVTRPRARKLVVDKAPEELNLRSGDRTIKSVSHVLLWLCNGDSSGTQDGERPPWEAGTRGLEGQQIKRTRCVYSELQTDCRLCNSDRLKTVVVWIGNSVTVQIVITNIVRGKSSVQFENACIYKSRYSPVCDNIIINFTDIIYLPVFIYSFHAKPCVQGLLYMEHFHYLC
jgi:hypothetical protein